MSDIVYWIWLSCTLGPANTAGELLLDHFDANAYKIYSAQKEEYEEVKGLKPKTINALLNKDLSEAKHIKEYCIQNNIGMLAADSEYYPKRLYRIRPKPIVLYYLGKIPNIDDNLCVAVVGMRKLSSYGARNAYTIGYDLAKSGAIVVSGMASGIDARAHKGCIDAGGITVAVLGCGIDRIYPEENTDLWMYIQRKGLIVTEYKPGTPPFGSNFPMRNRIISGLCQAALIIEADYQSGALITARHALYQGREIYALPGNVGEFRSLGTNSLIQNGANMITSAVDIVKEYVDIYPAKLHIENIDSFRSPKRNWLMKRIAGTSFDKNKANDVQDEINIQSPTLPPSFKPLGFEKKTNRTTTKDKKSENKQKVRKTNDTAQAPQIKKEVDLSKLSENELSVYNAIPDSASISPDEISRAGIPISKVMPVLTMLEIKGLITSLPGGRFKKKD